MEGDHYEFEGDGACGDGSLLGSGSGTYADDLKANSANVKRKRRPRPQVTDGVCAVCGDAANGCDINSLHLLGKTCNGRTRDLFLVSMCLGCLMLNRANKSSN